MPQVIKGVTFGLKREGDILVFLPGMLQLHRARRALERRLTRKELERTEVVLLHGSLGKEEQDAASAWRHGQAARSPGNPGRREQPDGGGGAHRGGR
ncbi:unnamed protein product, partial [Heterosigma akashiwo]